MRALPLSILAALLAVAPAHAEDSPSGQAEAAEAPPSLVVMVSVDQFSADLFAQYRRRFTGGLARLQEGVVFPSGYQAHAATETCPGHATLLTGARPARSGIVANNWFAPGLARADKRIYCAEDERDPASTSSRPVVSARQLKVPTLGERLKQANPLSRTIAVSAKDRAAVMMGGRIIDEGWWWQGGAFATFAGRGTPRSVAEANRAAAATVAKGAAALPMPKWCAARDRAIAVGKRAVGSGRFALPKGQPDLLRTSPRMDAATVDLALGLAREFELGRDAAPDVLAIGLSATDYIGHVFGTEGLEMCIQMAELDRSVGRLLAGLDALKVDYAVVLSADHGGLDTPERLDIQAYPRAARANPALTPEALAAEVTARTGIAAPGSGPMLYGEGPAGDLYVTDALPSQAKARVVAALVEILGEHPQVAAVFTARQLAEMPMPTGSPQDWSLRDRARASFDPFRSGDLTVLLDRAVVPIVDPDRGAIATHGSAWDYDRRVPILFWRRGMAGFEQPAPVETVDIAPTLARLLRLDVPDGAFDGRCLDLDPGEGNTCAR